MSLLKTTCRSTIVVTIAIVMVLTAKVALAQDFKKDSLERLLAKTDLPAGERVFTLGRLAVHEYFSNDRVRGDSLLDKAFQLAHTLKDKQYLAKTLAIQAMQQRIKGESEQSQQTISAALDILNNVSSTSINGYVWYACGWLQARDGHVPEAVESFIQAIRYYDQSTDRADMPTISSIYTELYAIYGESGDYANMEKYARLALVAARKSGSTDAQASALYSLAHAFEAQYRGDAANQPLLDSAHHYYHEAINILTRPGGQLTVQSQRPFNALGLANLYSEFYPLSYRDSAQRYLDIALNEGLKTRQYSVVSGAYGVMYEYAERENRLDDAENYLNLAAQYIQKSEMPDPTVLIRIMESLASVSERKGDYRAALEYYKKYMEYYKILFDNEKMAITKELEAKYSSEVKEQKLLLLEAQVAYRKKTSTIYMLLAVAVFIALIFVFIAYRQRSRAFEQQQRLHEMELDSLGQQHKISLLSAMIDGHEKERTRIARDLHDGLGGLLSGLKIELSGGAVATAITAEHKLIHNALARIDQAVNELRSIARNMMPELLLKYGLDEAVREFCQSLKRSGVNITFQSFHYQNNLDKNKQVVAYRVAQELINNAVKYAKSQHILVELRQNNDILSMTIEDDGIGFNTSADRKGSGLYNVEARIAFLNGQLHMDSVPGTGTTIELEFPI